MSIKSFAEWELEQRERLAAQNDIEARVHTELHMVAIELGRRFQLDCAKAPSNTVRLTRNNGASLFIKSTDGESFDLTRHAAGGRAENIGLKLSIDQTYVEE